MIHFSMKDAGRHGFIAAVETEHERWKEGCHASTASPGEFAGFGEHAGFDEETSGFAWGAVDRLSKFPRSLEVVFDDLGNGYHGGLRSKDLHYINNSGMPLIAQTILEWVTHIVPTPRRGWV
jgi:hypothetical protein